MRRTTRLQPARVALPDPQAAGLSFDAAASTFDDACAAHDHARTVLLARLRWLALAPKLIVDAGCGTGRGCATLIGQFPQAQVVAADTSLAMLAATRARSPRAAPLCSDAHSLPLPDGSTDLILANLILPWCDPQALLREFARVLAPSGLVLLSTSGPATLQEVRRAWRDVDDDVHVHAGVDIATLGDLFMQAGLREPVLDVDRVLLRYSTPARLHEELRASGAVNAAGGRRATLTGTGRFRRYEQALVQHAGGSRGITVTFELVCAQAFGRAAAAAETAPEFFGIPVRGE